MLKRFELQDPNSCINRAKPEEPVFVLLGRDAAAPDAIRMWIDRRVGMGKNSPDDAQIREAEALIVAMRKWQER